MRKSRVNLKQRRIIIERAQGCCEYCLSQANFSTQSLSVEHIIPLAKGGIVVGITNQLGIPIQYIGIGEKIEDLRSFEPAEFVKAMFD